MPRDHFQRKENRNAISKVWLGVTVAKEKLKKHLPKRCSNERLKTRRAASWARTQTRKEERRREQKRREKQNRELRAAGLLTPWETQCARRWAERWAKPRPAMR